jgi:hypothetical protein
VVQYGHQGISHFAVFQAERVAGQVAFGENSLYPTRFGGPGGSNGISPAVAPLEHMVIALELKKGIPGVGTVGVEDTYIVTPDGGQCITGGGRGIIVP